MVFETKKMVDLEHGRIDRNIFYSEEIYQQELERIFTRAWLLIGHDSLVPNPNDFFTTYMGEDPVILTRDAKGQLHAMLNMCRHRGNRVVRADDGNAKNFMCTYHGWTYSSDGGKLVSVPGLQEAYYGELDVEHLGLIEVAQLDSWAGFIFATWDPEAPTLEEYLGDARYYMDMFLNRRDGGVQLIGPDKWILPTNWKMPTDNFGTDHYHVGITHRSHAIARAKVTNAPSAPLQIAGRMNPMYSVYGHGVGTSFFQPNPDPDAILRGFQEHPMIGEYRQAIQPEMERRFGTFRARGVAMGVGALFPNVALHERSTMIRLWLPRGPQKTEVWAFQLLDKEASPEMKTVFRRNSLLSFGVAGIQEVDDADNWNQCVASSRSLIGRRYMQVLSLGVGKTEEQDILPGYRSPNSTNEDRQRGLYKWWQEFMDAESWADIPVYPPTATYEGTATFNG